MYGTWGVDIINILTFWLQNLWLDNLSPPPHTMIFSQWCITWGLPTHGGCKSGGSAPQRAASPHQLPLCISVAVKKVRTHQQLCIKLHYFLSTEQVTSIMFDELHECPSRGKLVFSQMLTNKYKKHTYFLFGLSKRLNNLLKRAFRNICSLK